MGALITANVHSLSAQRFRNSQADKTLWVDMRILLEQRCFGKEEEWKVSGCGAGVYSSFWRGMELDEVHGWDSWNIEIIGARNWGNKVISLELLSGNSDSDSKEEICEAWR